MKIIISNEKIVFQRRTKKKAIYIWNQFRRLELILHPMAEDAKEATGSMGDDTLAVLIT